VTVQNPRGRLVEIKPFIGEYPKADVWDLDRPYFKDVTKWGSPVRRNAPVHFPPYNWDVLMDLPDHDHLVRLVNMSFKSYFADFPSSTFEKQGRREAKTQAELWTTESNKDSIPGWSRLPLLPAYYAIQLMQRHPCKTNTRKVGQLMVEAPKGDCGGKQFFVDKSVSMARIRTCCFMDCPHHPAESFPGTEDNPQGGPPIVWTVFQAQHWGKSRLTAEAIERFYEEIDNRSDVNAYLARVVLLRKKRLRERQGVMGGSKLRRTAIH